MVLQLYYVLLGLYGLILAVSLFYYLSRKAPGGDASVGWALGIVYSGVLALLLLIALLLRQIPWAGIAVLLLPLLNFARLRLKRVWTRLYTRIPIVPDAPPLLLLVENNKNSRVHIRLEAWFSTSKRGSFSLYNTLDYYAEPSETTEYQLDSLQTRILAHKAAFVRIMLFENVTEQHEGHTYTRDVQPCFHFYEQKPETFRLGTLRVVIDP
jgi:hypothetical protein